MTSRTTIATAIAAVLGIGAGAVGMALLADDPDPASQSTIAPDILAAPDGSVLAAGLVQAADCTDLAATMRALADEYGLYGNGFGMFTVDMMADEAAMDGAEEMARDAAAPQASGAADGEAGGADGDVTNVQEVGVDEPDIVELVGGLVVTGTEGTLRVVEVSGGTPVERGSLTLGQWGGDLGLFRVADDRVAVLVQTDAPVRAFQEGDMIRPGGWSSTTVVLVDISDPDAPRELSRVDLEGWLVDARAVDGVLRVAVRSDGPQIDVFAGGEFDVERKMDWDNATQEDYERFDREYQAEYERRLDAALAQVEPEHWQPFASVDGTRRPLVDCDRIGFPTAFSGMGTLTMAAIDATGDRLDIDDAEAVVTSGENLYATTDRVVIATTRWEPCCPGIDEPMPVEPDVEEPEEPVFEEGEAPPPPPPDETPDELVDPAEPPPAEEEPAPSEEATPDEEPTPSEEATPDEEPAPSEEATADVLPMIAPPGWGGWGRGGTTDLHVFDVEGTLVTHVASGSVEGSLLNQYSMSIHDGVLRTATTAWSGGSTESFVTTFRIEGTDLVQLGQVGDLGPNEDIQAVRFMGEVGYVVTFRRTDPLYVVDLSDPAAPRTRGELKIEGYSAYLHPLGPSQLLGVGQDADPETGFTRGTQVSTFDVADPARPSRIDVDVTPDSSSEVEWDPHALTVTTDRHAIVPVEIWGNELRGRLGALLYSISDDGQLTRLGLLNTGSDWHLRPRRTLDLGDVFLTVGERGVTTWDRTTFAVVDTVRFDAPAFEGKDDGLAEEEAAREAESGGGRDAPGFDPQG